MAGNDIQQRIKDISMYFRGMQVESVDDEQIIYVIVQFPPKWFIDDTIEEKFGVTVRAGNDYQGQWYFFAEMGVGFDTVFDSIDYNIEKMKSAQERAALLQIKVRELQDIYANEEISLEALRTLEFTWKGKKKQPALPPKQTKQTENKTEKETEDA